MYTLENNRAAHTAAYCFDNRARGSNQGTVEPLMCSRRETEVESRFENG